MKNQILFLFNILMTTFLFGQTKNVNSEIFSQNSTENLFTDSLKKQLGIVYPIQRVYKCKDNSGQFFIVLTESRDAIIKNYDTLNYNIKAFCFRQEKNELVKKWGINDFVIKQKSNDEIESSIWFWTKYSEFTDIDNDGFIEPIIVYGTNGINGTSDGRIKILLFYKGQKIVIRHQNGILDFERNTYVDRSFYLLPIKLQRHIKQIITKIISDDNAIFPYGWQAAMKNKKLYFDEN